MTAQCRLLKGAGLTSTLMQRDPARIAVNEPLQKRPGFLRKLAMFIEQAPRPAYICLRLLHAGHVEEHQRLAQMMVGTKAPTAPGDTLITAPGLPLQAL